MNKPKLILFGITGKSHTEIGLDELYGLKELGYKCERFDYGGMKGENSMLRKFYTLFFNATRLLIKTYRFKPDFIYFNSRLELIGSTRDFITVLLLRMFYFKKVKVIIKSHGSDLDMLTSSRIILSRIIIPFLKKNVSAWLFLSSEEIDWIKSRNLIDNHKLFQVKNIVRAKKFKKESNFNSSMGIPIDRKILIFVGRLIKEKGIQYCVDAFIKIRETHNIFLIVVGDGEELETAKKKIAASGLKSDVLFTGWVDESTVTRYISNSEILIMPTFFPEGFPMVLFNSLAAGLSIITTPCRAAKDYLNEPENCLWVEPRSTESIISQVTKLLSEKKIMESMTKNNKNKAQLFTKVVVANELSQIFKTF